MASITFAVHFIPQLAQTEQAAAEEAPEYRARLRKPLREKSDVSHVLFTAEDTVTKVSQRQLVIIALQSGSSRPLPKLAANWIGAVGQAARSSVLSRGVLGEESVWNTSPFQVMAREAFRRLTWP